MKDGVLRTNDRSADVLHGITRIAPCWNSQRERRIPIEIGAIGVDQPCTTRTKPSSPERPPK